MFALVAWVLAPAVPPAPPPRPAALEIVWAAPDACPDETALRESVLALAALDEHGEGTLFVDGAIEASGDAFELRLSTRLGALEDERAIRDSDCEALVQAAALLVAVSVDPDVGPPPEDVAPKPEPVAAAKPQPPRASTPASVPEQPSATVEVRPDPPRTVRPWKPGAVFVGVAPQLEFGALPGLSGGPRVSFGLQWKRASVAAYGLYGAPRRTDAILGASGLAQMGAAGFLGCGNPLTGSLRLPICAVIEGGGIRVASRGLDPANRVLSPWTAAGARVGVERRWGRVGVYSAGEVLVPVVRTDVLLGEASSFTTWAVSMRLVVGLKIFFATESA